MNKPDVLHWKRLVVMYSQLVYDINNIKTKINNIKQNIEPEDFELGFELEHKMLDVEEIFVELEDLLDNENLISRT